jgi:hypothetical protein
MATAIFIVIYARNKWWIDLNGHSQGPFLSEETATSEAIKHATTLARAGKRAEVQVAAPGKKNKIVYQSAPTSFLGRATALTNH